MNSSSRESSGRSGSFLSWAAAQVKLGRLRRHRTHNATSPAQEGDQLGKYSGENEMPLWLRDYLLSQGQYSDDGRIDLIAEALKQNPETDLAYLCHPAVCHITKLRYEGSFCGYRNIQMLISHLLEAHELGPEVFPGGMPNIFELQDRIEQAWDNGYNIRGRIETGGIKKTRKFIGTLECIDRVKVQALLLSLNIKCRAQRIKGEKVRPAIDQLQAVITSYFWNSPDKGLTHDDKIRRTQLPPIYLQRPGHSLTVVGVETTTDNGVHLLVFNPARRYKGDAQCTRPLSMKQKQAILEIYRLRPDELRKYSEFELLFVNPSQS